MRIKKIFCCVFIAILILISMVFVSPIIYTSSLNKAIKRDDVTAVKRMLERGGDINRANSFPPVEYFGDTPLQEACIQGNLEIITMLLDHGAEINTEELTPLSLALSSEYPDKYEVVELLIERGAALSGSEVPPIIMLLGGVYDTSIGGIWFRSPKDSSTHEEMYQIFLLLIQSGVSLDYWEQVSSFTKNYPNSMLDYATYQGNVKILQYLIEKEGLNINEKFYEGRTLLMIAVEQSRKEAVEYLLAEGIDVIETNEKGETARDIAEKIGDREIIQLLSGFSQK